MANKHIMTRIQILAGTRAEWEVKGSVVLLPNEYAVAWESKNAETGSYSGLIGIKLGDGVTPWSELKYLDQDLKDIIATLDESISKEIADFKEEFVNYKDNQAAINNMQAQSDAALLTKIQKNREDIAAEVAAREALASEVANGNEELAKEIADFKTEFVGYKNDMANVHNMQAQVDAKLMDDIHAVENDLAAESARATAAEQANAAEIARVDSVLKAAIENDGEGIDSIKELATWVEEHGKDAADIVKAVEDEAKARADADAELAQDLINFKNEQAQIHNMQAQNDAALLVKIQQNRENLANEVAAREALEAAALQTVSTGVGLKAEKTGTDAKVEIDDSVVFILNCGSAADL